MLPVQPSNYLRVAWCFKIGGCMAAEIPNYWSMQRWRVDTRLRIRDAESA